MTRAALRNTLRQVVPWLLALLALVACRADPAPPPADPVDAELGWSLLVREPGPRWLGPDWWRAQGLDPEALGPEQVHLYRAGASEPFLWAPGPDGAPGLLFYGQTAPSRMGPVGAYTLTVGSPGVTMLQVDAPATTASAQTATAAVQRIERDEVYRTTAPIDSPWLWTSLVAPQAMTLTVPLTDALAAPVTLTLQVWGQSSMPADPDHHLRVLWNGELVDDHFWDGSQAESWSVVIDEAQAGENQLTLYSPGDTDAPVEVTWIDAVSVTWSRALRGHATNWTTWSAVDAEVACWDELPDAALALFVTPDGVARHDLARNGARGCVAQSPGGEGWIGVPGSAPAPDRVRPREALPAEARTAAYLIVASRAFHDALAPLAAARTAEGLDAAIVTPEQLYDAFGDGRPAADTLARAVEAFSNAEALLGTGTLRYLLLVGDASADPRAIWQEPHLVPTSWVRTTYVGDTPSDHALVADANGAPRVAVGRFPATTAADVEAIVAKTLAWEPTPRLLLLNDDEPEFVALVDKLAEPQAPDLRLDAGDPDVRRELLRWLRAEPGTLVYTGHGSLPLLGDEKLLTLADAGAWDGPTVVAAWTCLCAGFTHPVQNGLGETWLRDARGTVAVVGPTGETTTAEQSAMAVAFQRSIAGGARLGDALVEGWRAASSDDARVSFLLLGDPALRVMPGGE